MRPNFKLLANGSDLTPVIADRLLSLTITDERGDVSDAIVVEIDNRDGTVDMPPTGATLEPWLGFKETGLGQLGVFTCDEVEIGGSPRYLTIEGKAADMQQEMKAHKTRSWPDTTLGGIVSTIAGEHGLAPSTSADLASVAYTHIDQTDESDLHFLTRLGRAHNAVAKPTNRHLVMMPRGQARSASGLPLTPVLLTPADLAGSWNVRIQDRGKHGTVRAYWHNLDSAQRVRVEAGSGAPSFSIRDAFPTEAEARAAATAKLRELNRGTATFQGTFIGRSTLAAEAPLTLSNFDPAANGEWIISRVTHSLREDSGYRCSIEAERKE